MRGGRHSIALTVAAGLLGGCLDAGLPGAPTFVSTQLAEGAVTVRGPVGYCVDPRSKREQDGTGFVMLGSCASIANSARASQPAEKAVLTASVSGESILSVAEAGDEMTAYLQTDAGRATLARDGLAGSVDVLATAQIDNVLLVQTRDVRLSPDGALAGTYWRGFFDLGQRIVTVSVFGLADRSLSDRGSQDLLLDFVDSIRAANPAA